MSDRSKLRVGLVFFPNLGGDLEILDCKENEGCTFRLVIQNSYVHESHFEQIARQEMKPEKAVETTQLTNAPLSGQKLLLVDDSPDNLLIVSRFLRAAGADVVTAQDGEGALEKARQEFFSAIIMDVQMPRMDGETATMHLREQGYDHPVIALTAHAMRADRERGLKVGFSDYITKPVDRSHLIRKLVDLAGPAMSG